MRAFPSSLVVLVFTSLGSGQPALADPLAACWTADAATLGACLQREREAGDLAMEEALGRARAAAQRADQEYGGEIAVLALEASQQAWQAYRDTACEARAALLGGGDAVDLVEIACVIDLTRTRAEELRNLAGRDR